MTFVPEDPIIIHIEVRTATGARSARDWIIVSRRQKHAHQPAVAGEDDVGQSIGPKDGVAPGPAPVRDRNTRGTL